MIESIFVQLSVPTGARLREMGVRYVVVSPWRFSPETRAPAGLTMVAALEGVVIFEVGAP